MRNIFISFFLVFVTYGWSQVLVINELDANDTSIDDEEFIEIKSQTPNFTLDGYILVFFNGNNTAEGNNLSYLAFDLAGLKTDGNGLFVMGNKNVFPFPQVVINDGLFQNGPDGVAIYQTSINNFPDKTPATSGFNLVEALVYDTSTNSPVDNDLLMALGETTQYFEGSSSTNLLNSIQRKADGTYESKLPTPRALNDASGVIVNPVTIIVDQIEYNEGDSFFITFTAATNVDTDTNFNITLVNGEFTTGDYSGSTNITISQNTNTASTFIVLLDDFLDEGDEELIIEIENLEQEFQPTSINPAVAGNNFITIRVIDNDFTTAPWGTPLMPTYTFVTSTQPANYYSSLNGKSGQALRDAVTAIIADENTVRTHSYADVYDILAEADQYPLNSNQVWMLYVEQPRSKLDRQTTGSSTGKWNREHTFPRSRADFDEWEDFDDFATGINSFISTSVDSSRHGYSDAHALRVADGGENSRRNNRNYSNNFGAEEYNGAIKEDMSISTSFRGDVARSVMYMELRYNGLTVVNGFPPLPFPRTGELGDLATLLQWHQDDTPDDFEMNRNNIVYQWQRNRNPFIDLPDLVDYIWGDKVGMIYNGALSTDDNELNRFTFYPNPVNNKLIFEGLNSEAKVVVYSIEGRKISTLKIDANNTAQLNLDPGIYLLKVKQNEAIQTKRLVVK
ncbi:MAG: T9SS type A sorting domain-containing protein [Winogradskyella sp.]|uniref:endonuclease n=1 Tax=Winogradskyella sp. TaxID=1883156 RepID=UPI0017B89A29|nr:endonuclease [Winogradskyella sp.]MBT8245372.1 endonuclease [Winogradskyella sp.]NNK23625.1 T9SS type A sorting domain-containing protein [Winogradskyella sp.]